MSPNVDVSFFVRPLYTVRIGVGSRVELLRCKLEDIISKSSLKSVTYPAQKLPLMV